MPRTWKPAMPPKKSMKRSPSMSSSFSTQSGLSVCSTVESFEAVDGAASTCIRFGCATPTSSLESPRELADEESVSVSNTGDTTKGKDNNTKDSTITPLAGRRTRLKGEAPSFQPMPTDTRFDVVANAVCLALASCGQTHKTTIEKGLLGPSSTLISAQVFGSSVTASRKVWDVCSTPSSALCEMPALESIWSP